MRFVFVLIILMATVSAQADVTDLMKEIIRTTKLVNGVELVKIEGALSQVDTAENPPAMLFRHDTVSIAYSGVVAGYENNFDQCVVQTIFLNKQQPGVEYICLNRGDYARLALSN